MAAGEFFDLIFPAVLLLSAVLSTWVLASARKVGFPDYIALAWALATLIFPPVVLPLYLIARYAKRRRNTENRETRNVRHRFAWPTLYLLAVTSFISLYGYNESMSADAYLAQAAKAKLKGDRAATIREYRKALALENNPHTRKLLAIELVSAGFSNEALSQFRLAEQGGEPDDTIAFQIALLLDGRNHINQARLEYERFLTSQLCTQDFPDQRCRFATERAAAIKAEQ